MVRQHIANVSYRNVLGVRVSLSPFDYESRQLLRLFFEMKIMEEGLKWLLHVTCNYMVLLGYI